MGNIYIYTVYILYLSLWWMWWPIRQVPRTAAWKRTRLNPMALISFSSSNAWCVTNIWHILVTAGLMHVLQQSSNMAGWSIYVHLFSGVVPPALSIMNWTWNDSTLDLLHVHDIELANPSCYACVYYAFVTPNLHTGTRANTHTHTVHYHTKKA